VFDSVSRRSALVSALVSVPRDTVPSGVQRFDHMFGISNVLSTIFEHAIGNGSTEGAPMTVIETIHPTATRPRPVCVRPAGHHARMRGPHPSGPAGGRPRYRGSGVLMSTAPHRPRPITPATTVGLALLAAAITVWLGLVAQFGEALHGTSGDTPERLAVVRVEPGETLTHLAARVAPDAPAGRVVERIRDLNGLESAAPVAGQTLIAPVG
jgi:hypothetical protein